MRLPENLRGQLRIPFGTLIPDENITKEIILKQIPDDSYVITVGDATTEKMLKLGIVHSLQIIDEIKIEIKKNLQFIIKNFVD